ncbi:LamG domain-containing protein [Halorussus sp. MSC15.2]|uniref:LamG domain-containing protein n=1 Tax=Halorussus sp. MSC15.2 TaxID=2283638 RepID=UPI0013D04E1A|nr:LamG domain-containing protein [Halorussus sp. MSC15.2]NEU58601.1 LamG domain-containing protein [Halorussus sp. MSC15.2]
MDADALRRVADWFHDREGTFRPRTGAVSAIARKLDVDATRASKLVAGLTGDDVDPVIAVRTHEETFVGILDYREGDGWYGYTDYHDLRGPHRRGVCAQCVHEATTDEDVRTVTTTNEDWDALEAELGDHYERAHPDVAPETVNVETGAILRSRTTVGGNRVWHTGNDGAGSGFGAASVDGLDGATLNRRHSSDVDRHLDLNRLGLRAWYRFDRGSGGTLYDYVNVGSNRNGELRGPTWVSGRNGGSALSFDGSDDYVALRDSYATSGALDEFTVCVWYRSSASSPTWSFYDFDRSEYFQFGFDSGGGGDIQFATTDPGNSQDDMYTSGTSWNDGSWHLACAVYDGTDKYIYVDGSVEGGKSGPHNGAAIGTGVTRYGYVGAGSESNSFDGNRNNNNFEGDIDEVRFYTRALSGSEIRAIYDGVA